MKACVFLGEALLLPGVAVGVDPAGDGLLARLVTLAIT